ncbi:MAG: hypothetical protein JSW26_23975 [Desulfobacterales bacterium]|nr:MAG: hypothetical protein JSW26_23975 [Desulfobacterales bacterium]
MKKRVKLREEILEQLKSFGITGKDVYFIDYIPLIEMMWADGQTQQAELEIFYEFLEKHVEHLNQMAGYEAFKLEDAVQFVARFLKERPSPEILETLRNLAACSGLHQANQKQRTLFEKSLLTLCLDIASSSVIDYPCGVQERFSAAEKRCFFEILDTFEKT